MRACTVVVQQWSSSGAIETGTGGRRKWSRSIPPYPKSVLANLDADDGHDVQDDRGPPRSVLATALRSLPPLFFAIETSKADDSFFSFSSFFRARSGLGAQTRSATDALTISTRNTSRPTGSGVHDKLSCNPDDRPADRPTFDGSLPAEGKRRGSAKFPMSLCACSEIASPPASAGFRSGSIVV